MTKLKKILTIFLTDKASFTVFYYKKGFILLTIEDFLPIIGADYV